VSAYQRATEIVDKLQAEGISATLDPRSATPPCVLVTPPSGTYDLACGFTARWQLQLLVPGPGNADAFKALDELRDQVAGVLEVREFTFGSYALSPDNPPFPAYRIDFEEAI
jgi:hypothetical protein